MKNGYRLLLTEQLKLMMPNFKSKKHRADALGSFVIMAVLVAMMIVAFVVIFGKFVETYTAIKIDRVSDVQARQYEIMSIVYFILFVLCIFVGVGGFCRSLFEDSDMNIIITMPFSGAQIFFANTTAVYLRQVAFTSLFLLPVNLTFFKTTGLIDAYNVVMTFAECLLLPVISLGVSAVVVLPYYWIKKKLTSRYALTFVLITLVAGVFMVGYGYVFGIAEDLLSTGRINSLFNEKVMNGIIAFSKSCFPANYLADLMLKRNVNRAVGVLLLTIAVCAATCLVVVRAVFIKVSQAKLNISVPHPKKKGVDFAPKNRLYALIRKEFLLVLRTPNYSFMYFTTALTVPIMAYFSAKIGAELFGGVLNVKVGFELCTFVTVLYGSLTNTFCSTNISRDGYMAMSLKTMPFSASKVLTAKMLFCAAVSVPSILLTAVVLAATGLETLKEAVMTFASAAMITVAQIMFATRLDLNHPHFPKTDYCEIKEAGSTVSIVIMMALLVSGAFGTAMLYQAIAALLGNSSAAMQNANGVSTVISLVVPAVLLLASAVYFSVGLKSAYRNLNAEV